MKQILCEKLSLKWKIKLQYFLVGCAMHRHCQIKWNCTKFAFIQLRSSIFFYIFLAMLSIDYPLYCMCSKMQFCASFPRKHILNIGGGYNPRITPLFLKVFCKFLIFNELRNTFRHKLKNYLDRPYLPTYLPPTLPSMYYMLERMAKNWKFMIHSLLLRSYSCSVFV